MVGKTLFTSKILIENYLNIDNSFLDIAKRGGFRGGNFRKSVPTNTIITNSTTLYINNNLLVDKKDEIIWLGLNFIKMSKYKK